MHDIRNVLNVLSPADRELFAEARTALRSAYLATHGAVCGILNWEQSDDLFLDYTDIKLLQLFERAERYKPDEVTAKIIAAANEDIALNERGQVAVTVETPAGAPQTNGSAVDLDHGQFLQSVQQPLTEPEDTRATA